MAASSIWSNLHPTDQQWLLHLAELAYSLNSAQRIALVGGAVRDAYLGRTPSDLDVVLEHGQIETLAQATNLPYIFHPEYQNATLTLPDGRSVDLVRSRAEQYPVAGANPHPLPGHLEDDLQRRDFAINALALVISPQNAPYLFDPTGGQTDLQQQSLRPLHAQSFHEDASRLIRAARLAARLNLAASPQLLQQVPQALAIAQQTPRLWAEMRLLLTEPQPSQVAWHLQQWGAAQLLPEFSTEILKALDQLKNAGHEITFHTYAAGFLAQATDQHMWSNRLQLGQKPLKLLQRALGQNTFKAHTPEYQLRQILRPESYQALTGKDILALGITSGPMVGAALQHLANLRAQQKVHNADQEREALHTFLTSCTEATEQRQP